MKILLNNILLVLLLIIISTISCSDEQISITLIVASTYDEFSGYYIVNGKIDTFTAFTSNVFTNNVAFYEAQMNDVDYIEISATAQSNATSISISIYRDNVKIKSISKNLDPNNSSENKTIELEYNVNASESE